MSSAGYNITKLSRPVARRSGVRQAALFIVPSLVITGISIVLFSLLTNFTQPQLNHLSISIFAAIIVSLLAAAGIQLLVYRIVEDHEYFSDGPAKRGIKAGILAASVISLILVAALLPYFILVLNFTYTEFLIVVILTLLYTATWVITSAFWASEKYLYPAIIFTLGYLGIFAFTYGAYRLNPEYTTVGYALGTGFLFLVAIIGAIQAFPKPLVSQKLRRDFTRIRHLWSQNLAAFSLGIFFVLALFADKIIVWVAQGRASGQGLTIPGYYTAGAFLGLIPTLSIGVIAYFSAKTKRLVDERYQGTYKEIQQRIRVYKSEYVKNFTLTLCVAFVLAAAVSLVGYYYISDTNVFPILVTIAAGSIFFSGIIFNSMVLPLFGKYNVTLAAVLVIIFAVIITYPLLEAKVWFTILEFIIARFKYFGVNLSFPFIQVNMWYSSLGFLIGSFIGFLISSSNTLHLFSKFEFNMFRFLLKSQ